MHCLCFCVLRFHQELKCKNLLLYEIVLLLKAASKSDCVPGKRWADSVQLDFKCIRGFGRWREPEGVAWKTEESSGERITCPSMLGSGVRSFHPDINLGWHQPGVWYCPSYKDKPLAAFFRVRECVQDTVEPTSQMRAGGKGLLLFLSFIRSRGLSGLLTRPIPTSSPLFPAAFTLWSEGQWSPVRCRESR